MNNKELVRTAMTRLFGQRDLGALDDYWDPGYVQHNPRMPNGLGFFRQIIPSLPADFRYEPGLVLEDGEFVSIHGRYVNWSGKTMIGVDIFRVKEGRFVEHWDVIQEEVPATQSLTGNAMFPIA
ncbi:nuclear transport factor 2 family protein [Pseudacidovorax intermedius]|uniref:Integron gene cassette protein n=1 Tax=Pseudacidovorax intermedius TaxID=433924 RepID=A0A147HCA3_9BURK|nr:nuclear transport factor 2 family protein [Pseudacidovorax intermedius]KTT27726.1 integron gene cassette protein [Pseudacidovorax intermedius]